VADVHRLRDAARNTVDAWLVIGEVMMIHIADDLLADGVYDTALARPILRGGGGSEYFEINPASRFDMRRPRA
jgi:flavin reductase (DIM6/NTAB) family NADH-FMN oxidoreductase RutF